MNLPVEVIEAVNEGRSVLFVGSRFSMEAAEAAEVEFPGGKDLATTLGWKKPRQMMGTRKKVITPSPEAGADLYQAAQGRPALVAKVMGLRGVHGVAPTAAHATAIRRFPLIFTTCQDDLLERAALELGGAAEVRYRGDEVPKPDPAKRVIYKMRGGFERPDGLLLSSSDREAAALEPSVRSAVRSLLRKQVIFFVGYRPDEEEFENLWTDLTTCYGGELPRCHLAVAQGAINDYLWQKWVWRGLLMFTADPHEAMSELEARIDA